MPCIDYATVCVILLASVGIGSLLADDEEVQRFDFRAGRICVYVDGDLRDLHVPRPVSRPVSRLTTERASSLSIYRTHLILQPLHSAQPVYYSCFDEIMIGMSGCLQPTARACQSCLRARLLSGSASIRPIPCTVMKESKQAYHTRFAGCPLTRPLSNMAVTSSIPRQHVRAFAISSHRHSAGEV